MSEYAGGSQPTIRYVEFENLDHTGTLFEDHFMNDVSLVNSSTAELPDTEIEQAPQMPVRYPETIAHRQQARRERLLGRRVTASQVSDGHERDTPYAELGGGLDRPGAYRQTSDERSLAENQDIILRDYQPWMRDITLAVERYGLLDITPGDIQRMTQDDQGILALYVDGFMSGLASIKQLIVQFEGVAGRHDFFRKYITPESGVPTPEMFEAYRKTLGALSQAIKQQGAAEYLTDYAAKKISPYPDARHAKRKRNKDAKKDTPYLYHDEKAHKYRVELVPLRRDGLPPY